MLPLLILVTGGEKHTHTHTCKCIPTDLISSTYQVHVYSKHVLVIQNLEAVEEYYDSDEDPLLTSMMLTLTMKRMCMALLSANLRVEKNNRC